MAPFSILLLTLCVSIGLVCVEGASYIITATGGVSCPTCNITLSDVISNPQTYLTSNTTLTFLPGTHILDHDGPVVVSDVDNLSFQGASKMEDGFHWTVKQTNVIIHCRNSTGGMIFNQSSINIGGITFTNCGVPLKRDFVHNRYEPLQNGLFSSAYNFENYTNLWSSLFFIDCLSIVFFQFSVQNCSGSCLYIVDTQVVEMNEVYIAHSTPDQLLECCRLESSHITCVGGNILFVYLLPPLNKADDVIITNSSFAFGAGPGSEMTTVLAGITIVNLRNFELLVVMNSTTFYGNSGGNFGALSGLAMFSFNNISSLRANNFGCLSEISFKVSVTNEILYRNLSRRVETRVIIHNSLFTENVATVAAGLNIDTSYVVIFVYYEAKVFFGIFNTLISNNRATIASGIGSGSLVGYPGVAEFGLYNVTLTGNTLYALGNTPYEGIPPSCIVTINTQLAYFSNVTIADHALAGIFSITSHFTFSGSTLIVNNTGLGRGGGLILQENSNIFLEPNTTVSFIDNKAEFGAAMYIYEPEILAFIYQGLQLCVYQIRGDPGTFVSKFYFSDNNASVTGNVVYGGYVSNCLLFSDPIVTPSRTLFPSVFDYANSQPNFDISSNANKLCFCQDGRPLYGQSYYNISGLFPGQILNVSVIPVGQDGGYTVGTVDVVSEYLNFTDSVSVHKAACFNMTLPLKYYGKNNHSMESFSNYSNIEFVLFLDPDSTKHVSNSLYVSITVDECPPGFTLNSSFICECESIIRQQLPFAVCSISNDSISQTGNVWVGYDVQENTTITASPCPFDYCYHGFVSFNIIDSPELQCASHRSGVLCGQCIEEYSLLLGSNECGLCPNDNYLSLLLVFGVAGVALVVLLIVLNLTVSVGTINGLVFYANIVKINENVFFPNGPVKVVSNFISFFNLDFGIKTCFYKEMTAYSKVWLQFAFPVYIWVIIFVIIVLSRYSSKLSKLVGSNAVPVLATLVLLTYTKLIRTYALIFRLSHLQQIHDSDADDLVWAVDGSIAIYSTKHNALLGFSIVIFFLLVLPFTVFVIMVPLLEKCLSGKCGKLWLSFLKPVLDAYSGPFSDSKRYWVGFGLVARVAIVVTVPVFEETTGLLIIFFVVVFLLSLFALFGGYYKSKYLNYLEVWTNLNLLTITVLALGDATEVGTLLTVSLMLLTFVGVVIFHIVIRILPFFPKSKRRSMGLSVSGSLNTLKKSDDSSLSRKLRNLSSAGSIDEVYDDGRFRESWMEYIHVNDSD